MGKWNLTKKTIGICVAVLAGVFLAGVGVARATQPPDQITADEALSIALKDAGKGAEEVTVTKQRPDVEDGIQTYDIEFFFFEGDSSVTEYDYEIEAATGRILERSRETEYVTRTPRKQDLWDSAGTAGSGDAAAGNTADDKGAQDAATGNTADDKAAQDDTPAQPQQPVQQPQQSVQQPQQSVQQDQQYIGLEQARAIALEHAGAGTEVWFTKEKQDMEDGRVVYEIEFYAGGVEYEYEIDALTGQIWDFDIDYDD